MIEGNSKNTVTKSSTLKKKLKSLDQESNEVNRIRVHRAISWLKCAEEQTGNFDMKFISLWIAFNACYADTDAYDTTLTERKRFNEFVTKLVKHDSTGEIFKLLWHKFSGPVRLLIDNKFAYKRFWDANKDKRITWEESFERAKYQSQKYLEHQSVDKLLEVVLDRLYTVRNQLLHGGATYQSKVNRAQVKDAVHILESLIPVIIDIMISNIEDDWGEINYPVIK